jgi:hypothetical protein
MTDVYTDVVGSLAPAWPASYNQVITRSCGHCKAQPFELCTGPRGETRRMPCVVRAAA